MGGKQEEEEEEEGRQGGGVLGMFWGVVRALRAKRNRLQNCHNEWHTLACLVLAFPASPLYIVVLYCQIVSILKAVRASTNC